MQCNAMQCNAMQCNAMQCNAMHSHCSTHLVCNKICFCFYLHVNICDISFSHSTKRIFTDMLILTKFATLICH